jgi:hypothetical protein
LHAFSKIEPCFIFGEFLAHVSFLGVIIHECDGVFEIPPIGLWGKISTPYHRLEEDRRGGSLGSALHTPASQAKQSSASLEVREGAFGTLKSSPLPSATHRHLAASMCMARLQVV